MCYLWCGWDDLSAASAYDRIVWTNRNGIFICKLVWLMTIKSLRSVLFIAYEKGRINGRLIRSVRQALEQYSLHTRLVRVKMTVLEGLERRQRQYVRMEKSGPGRRGGQSFVKGAWRPAQPGTGCICRSDFGALLLCALIGSMTAKSRKVYSKSGFTGQLVMADNCPFGYGNEICRIKERIMKKGERAEGRVSEVKFPNKALVQCEDGSICSVKNGLPGQKVSFVVKKVRKGRAEGQLLEVLEPAEYETDSPCPHFGACGGCSYQTVPYEIQLALKEKQVKMLLEPVLEKQKGTYRWESIRPNPQVYGYRNKMEFSFGDGIKGGPLELGLHKKGSFYDIVTVSECRIVDEDYRNIVKAVLAYFRERGVSFYHRLRHTGYLRHLLVRKAGKTGEILIALVTTTQETHDLTALKDTLLSLPLHGKITGILHTKNDTVSDTIKSDETIVLYGKDYFYEELLGLQFKISQFSFFQTNSRGAEVLYRTARELIGEVGKSKDGKPDQILFDLYSGTGTIAQMMAPVVKKVIGVEIVEEAVEAARENAKRNGLQNCEFIAGDVLKVLDTIEEKPDFIILDPPRDGIHPKALQKIIAYGVDRILYISCKPTSLARDLEVFLAMGYEAEKVTMVDMFSGTVHIETIVALSRIK